MADIGAINEDWRALVAVGSSAVTISNASPAVITWTAHALPVGTPISFSTTGSLPTGLTSGLVYYVSAVVDADSFNVSAIFAGSSVNTSSAGSGTHTATTVQRGPLTANFQTIHDNRTFAHTTTATITISNATPAVIGWTFHSLPLGTPVVFTTSGTLPTGLTPGTTYYVLAPITNSFNVSATVNGAAINTSSAGSGVHTGTTISSSKWLNLTESTGSQDGDSWVVSNTYYKMRGMDQVTSGLYDTWIVTGTPDFTASRYTGGLNRPLRDVCIVDFWTF